jgi:excinuclease ABC subunit B
MTGSMKQAIDETYRRRAKQLAYNEANNITPQSIVKSVDMKLAAIVEADYITVPTDDVLPEKIHSEDELRQVIAQMETQMREAAKKFEFERAAGLRDRIRALQQRELGGLLSAVDASPQPPPAQKPEARPAAAPAAEPAPAKSKTG